MIPQKIDTILQNIEFMKPVVQGPVVYSCQNKVSGIYTPITYSVESYRDTVIFSFAIPERQPIIEELAKELGCWMKYGGRYRVAEIHIISDILNKSKRLLEILQNQIKDRYNFLDADFISFDYQETYDYKDAERTFKELSFDYQMDLIDTQIAQLQKRRERLIRLHEIKISK